MIAHALDIIRQELKKNLGTAYQGAGLSDGLTISLDNVATLTVAGAEPNNQSDILISLVNMREEKTLKNLPNYVRNDITLKATYENQPVFVNFLILFSVVSTNYTVALTALSRIIRFFQSKNVFTQDDVQPASLQNSTLLDADKLESFKLILDLHSPTMEEANHLWGMLGGKQYPFVLYWMRMLDLKFRYVQRETGLVTEVVTDFHHKNHLN